MSKLISSARVRTSVKTCVLFAVTAVMAALSSGMLRGSMPNVATGTWSATGTLAGVRSGAASVLMADGTVLVTGGSDGTASVNEVQSYGTTGAFSAGAAMNEARAEHTAVLLGDGSVLVAGGRSGSSAVASAEILINGQWFAAGALTDARWGHTATLLDDGRVLIAGGENASGPLASIEIFDPSTGQISVVGALATGRKGHAAAKLADGRVIIAGGEDLNGVLKSTEIVDASSSSISPGPALASKRTGLSATRLLDGKVLFLGGNNGTSNLASAELFTPSTGAMTATASAAVARRDHQAFLLPNNNSVLIVGGIADTTVNGVTTTAPTAAAELFLSWLPAVWQTAPMSAARVKGTGAALSTETYGAAAAGEGLLMVAGGEGLNDSEAYRFATMRTDQIDYLPGETVYISASGWQPGETVSFGLRELPAEHISRTFAIQADANGEIVAAPLFLVEPHHFGVRFFLTATGAASQAQITFTDGNVKVRIAPSGTFALTAESFTTNGNTTCSGNPNQTTNTNISNNSNGDNVGAGNSSSIRLTAAPFSQAGGAFQGWSGTKAFTGTNPICIDVSSGSDLFTATYSLAVATTLTLTVTPQTVPFGSTSPVILSAIVRRASNNAFITGATVQFSVDGVTVGSNPSNSAGNAFRSYNPSTLNAGDHNVVASMAAQTISGTAYAASTSNTAVLTVNKADQSIDFGNLNNKTYGDAPFTLSATGGASGNPVTFATGAGSAGCSLSGTNNATVTITAATISNPCVIVASQAGNTNYNPAPDVTRAFSISKATLTVSADNASRGYGDPNPSFAASYSGFVNGETLPTSGVTGAPSLTTTATPASSVAGNPYAITAALGTLAANNYSFTFVNGQLTINKAELTVSADDASRFYGDANPSFTASYSGFKNSETLATSGVTGSPNLTSAANGTSSVAGSPYAIAVAAGTLAATNYSFKFVDGKLTVNRAQLSATAADAARDYGDPNPSFTGTLTGVKNSEAITATYASAATQTTAAATYGPATTNAIVPTVTGTPATLLDNYSVATTNGTLTINKAPLSATANDASRFYGDANPSFSGTLTGVKNSEAITATYASAAIATTAASAYGPSTANAIVPTVSGTPASLLDNYVVTTTNGTLTINKAPLSAAAADAARYYGDANPAFTGTFTGVKNGEAINATYVSNATVTTPVGIYGPDDPYEITASVVATPTSLLDNYVVATTDGTLTINRRPATIVADSLSKTYGDANPTLTATVTGSVNGDTLNYTLATTALQFSGVGSYPITVTLGTNANYDITPTDASLTINRRPATVVADSLSKTYGDANPTLTATVAGTVNNDALNYTLATTALQFSSVGSYPITLTLGTNGNYDITPSDGTLTVNRRLATVKANDKSRFYGDANPAFDATVNNTVNGDTLDYTLGTTATETTGVGSYPITVTLGTNPNYDVTPTNGLLTINRRLATVKANDKSRFYGDANPTFDAAVTGAANGDTLAYTLATTADQTTGVGNYPITVTLGTNPNYDITPTNGTLTINRRAASVSANNKGKTYGDDNPTLDAAVTGTANGDALNYTLATTAVKFSNVGNYPISVTLGANPNYDVTPADGTLAISARAASVTPNDKSKLYGDDNPALDAAVAGTVNNDSLNYTLSTTALKFSSVGNYPISVTLGTNPNYNVATTDGTLRIDRKAASVTADNKSKVYGDANPALTASVTGTVNGDTLSYTLATTAVQFSGVGSYPIDVTLGSNPNYDVAKTNGSLAVNPKAATVTANNKTREYGAANPTLTATVAGTANNDTLNYSLATTATTTSDVGPYSITVTLGTNPNYSVTPTDGTLTITRKSLTIKANDGTKILGAALTFAGTEFTSTGLVNGDTVTTVTLTSTGAAVPAAIGSYPIVPSAAVGAKAGNYDVTYLNGTLKVQFLWDGFLQPINDTAHDQHTTSPVSRFKAGQTIPAKFDLKNANGTVVTQTGSPTFNFARIGGACDSFTEPETLDMVYQPSSMPVYTLQGGHYQYNWSTKGLAVGLYEIYANLADGTSRSVYICLNK